MAEEFDPGNPLDAMAESFRMQVCDMVIDADKAAIFRDMSAQDKLQAVVAGTLTGLVGVVFAMVQDKYRDEAVKGISDFLPHAAEQAKSIMDDAA